MGQAFDRDGNVLGETSGATKADVLAALEKSFPDAEEIRIMKQRAGERDEMTKSDKPVESLEQFFAYAHLPAHLQAVSKPFGELAASIIATVPRNPERTVALRKLLEAKDCAVRALLYNDGSKVTVNAVAGHVG